jgi:hypothetical protein
LHATSFKIERFEIRLVEGWRRREGVQDADAAIELSIERRRVNARRLEQAALADRAVIRDGAPHQDAREQGTRQHRTENENQQVNANWPQRR